MSERTKNVKKSALAKAEAFLGSVYQKIGSNTSFSLYDLTKEFKIANTYATLLKELKIVEPVGSKDQKEFLWIYPRIPDRALAAMLVDELTRYNKGFKNSMLDKALKQSESPKDLFESAGINRDRLQVICAIATGVYAGSSIRTITNFTDFNAKIILAADDLLKQSNQ